MHGVGYRLAMTLGIRRRLLLVVIAAVVVSVAGLVAGFNLVLGRSLDRDSRDLVRSRAAAELSSLGVQNGRLTTSETPDERASDAYIWVFEGTRLLERPRTEAPSTRRRVRWPAGPRASTTSRRPTRGSTRFRSSTAESAWARSSLGLGLAVRGDARRGADRVDRVRRPRADRRRDPRPLAGRRPRCGRSSG